MTTPSTIDLAIDGMSCGHCVAAVRDALRELPGVTVQQVGIGSAAVTVDPSVTPPSALVEALRDAGYDASATARAATRAATRAGDGA